MESPRTDQCIVLPFQPQLPRQFNGIGLALHFLLGNVLVLHPALKEMWFGWRVKKIFPQQDSFKQYCREMNVTLDLAHVSRAQKIRFWIHGSFSDTAVRLHRFDDRQPGAGDAPIELEISTDDGLVRFRSRFMAWLTSMGLPMPEDQFQAALWPEKTGPEGLDAVGRALETFYLFSAYGGRAALDITPFKKSVTAAPESFMAHDLYGWALYRNQDYRGAKGAFLTSLRLNPAGAGAMSGLMWCGVYGKDLEETMFWSGRKAEACRQNVQAAREAGRRRFDKTHSP